MRIEVRRGNRPGHSLAGIGIQKFTIRYFRFELRLRLIQIALDTETFSSHKWCQLCKSEMVQKFNDADRRDSQMAHTLHNIPQLYFGSIQDFVDLALTIAYFWLWHVVVKTGRYWDQVMDASNH